MEMTRRCSETTWYFRDPESEDFWDHRVSHLWGTWQIICSNLYISLMWNKRNSMVWSMMLARDCESCLERTFVNHSVSLRWASPVSQPVCYILNTQQGVRRTRACSYSEKTVITHSVILYWASPVSQTVYYLRETSRDRGRPGVSGGTANTKNLLLYEFVQEHDWA